MKTVGDDRTTSGLPLIGLLRERQTLLNAIQRRESLLMLGPAGSGKTALVRSVLNSALRGQSLVHISRFEAPHDLLVSIARGLLLSRHGAFCRAVHGSSAAWTSVHLKGLLWSALEREPATIILDGITRAGHQTYRFLQRLYFSPGMTLVAMARNHLHLGELHRLFWDPRTTHYLQPLSGPEAFRLFEVAADHFELRHLSLDDFRKKVLDSAKGNPGQIVEMCRFAAKPMYITGSRHVKFGPLRIDVMMRLL